MANHTIAITSDGKAYAWGDGSSGKLGNGADTDQSRPVAVDMSGVLLGKTVVAAAAGGSHTLLLTSDGGLYSFGNNVYGQLGTGLSGLAVNTPVAVDMTGVLAGKTITQISAGDFFCLALDSDGKVYSWGNNSSGNLGDGSMVNRAAPVAVDISGVLSGKVVCSISAGLEHALALTMDGVIAAWGQGGQGSLGNGNVADQSSPVAVVTSGVLASKTITAVSAGRLHSLALSSDGRVFTWGSDLYGRLGDGNSSTTTTMNGKRSYFFAFSSVLSFTSPLSNAALYPPMSRKPTSTKRP
jgi:alpha-tubulin suppressor-like RCC1 family protein